MPQRPLHPCGKPGCRALVRDYPRCPAHMVPRPSSTQRGYGADWQPLRAQHLASHPWCVECMKQGKKVRATHVDHIVPHRGRDALRLDPRNLQSLCASHHSSKTAAQDHGFGNGG